MSSWKNHLGLAVGSGILLALAFPTFHIGGFAWTAPALILANALGARRKLFLWGWLSGCVSQLLILHWLLQIPFPWGALAGWLALSAYLGCFTGLWVLLSDFFLRRAGRSADRREAPLGIWRRLTWRRRLVCMLFVSAAWVSVEMLQARLFTGFPWNLLGVSQYRIWPLIQVASVTGVYGLSFLIVWNSLALASAVERLVRQPADRQGWMKEWLVPLAALAGCVAFGLARPAPALPSRTMNIALVQPSIPQTLIFDSREDEKRFGSLVQLTEKALATQPDLLIWPEAAVPGYVRLDAELREIIRRIARKHHVWILLGSDDAEPRKGGSGKEANYYNSSFLIDPTGEIRAQYRKRRLVIFGEYVPLVRWLPFVKYLTPIEGSFTPGDRVESFQISDPGATTSVLICFEDTFPHLAREYVGPRTDFLVNLTNDGWFGESAEQWQHAANAVFRSVENNCPLVRCGNNGLTCWIDGRGIIRAAQYPGFKTIYQEGFKLIQVPLLDEGEPRRPTVYNRFGDWFGWGCVGATILALAAGRMRRFQ